MNKHDSKTSIDDFHKQYVKHTYVFYYFRSPERGSAIGVIQNTIFGSSGGSGGSHGNEHELQLATYCQRAWGQDDGSLKKSPSNYVLRSVIDYHGI